MKHNRTTGQPGQRFSGYFVPHYIMATRRNHDRATAFGATDTPCSQAMSKVQGDRPSGHDPDAKSG